MSTIQDYKEKLTAQSISNRTGFSLDPDQELARPNLAERVTSQLRQAERQAPRAMRLAELKHLFEKHPDVARIFELMDEVRL